MRRSTVLLGIASFVSLLTLAAAAREFNCSRKATCEALIDYLPPNTTTLTKIRTLFGVKNLRSLLGANGMPLSTSPNETVPEKRPIRIPFPCICSDGTGISLKRPEYMVQAGDDLDHIAREVFAGLMTYQQIAKVNNISDPNTIKTGQRLLIPLPCSCDNVDGAQVVHYGHLVAAGSSIEQIAAKFGTSPEKLLTLNGITDPKTLQAGDVLDVPLKACTSVIKNTSFDYPLLLSSGTYKLTANNCVQCKCDSANNWTLQCEQSQGIKVSNWSVCPSMRCEGAAGELFLGNATSVSTCQRTTCAYAGYNKQSIHTTLANVSTCADEAPQSQPPPNHAPNFVLDGTGSWRFLLASLNLGLLCFGHLW